MIKKLTNQRNVEPEKKITECNIPCGQSVDVGRKRA
jgi:hypothetical protein